ncbi:hypothetical protein ANN_02946 [Periplaneta americana]|uniref:RNase H type-1 domain-containing protein n=1 Tax=Periplaneta americana TaxID=6978 RepID=A0ABQ8TXV1_PERAM|nr:hypothetical protein ANN_02946 [Periplaneta americana]
MSLTCFCNFHVVRTCGIFMVSYNVVIVLQMKLMPLGVENLVLVSDETRKQVYEAARRPPDVTPKQQQDATDGPAATAKKEKQWRVGGVEFEALMRMLDNAGFRTGYIYRHPLVKGEPPRPRNDVEVPPAVSSLGYLLEEEEMYKHGQWKKYMDGRKTHDRTRWLNSPNVYQKVEILETGTPDPKKITKVKWVDANAEEWVADGSPTHSSTPVKIESALQFVPKNTDPREFKKLQQQIKDNRRADKITSGPQSHILEGVSWEEAKKLQWIPSHCGILGNEKADALAKKGSTATYRPVTKSTYYSVKRVIKCTYLDFNKQNLITQSQGKKWNFLHHNPQLIPDLPRKSSVAAFRLATGHDCLAKHLHRIGIYQSPNCPLCMNCNLVLRKMLTVNYYLQDANISATGDQVILVGAASKGIIQRGFQHNAMVYKTPYAKNPFDTITDEELEEYKKVVERKQKGESFDEDQSESEPLSSSLQNSRPTNDGSLGAMKSPLTSPMSAASETEEESRDEPRVLRIETKQVPRPSQAEVVLSDG